jgi:hypothetical protein
MHFNKKLSEEVCAMERGIKEFIDSGAGAAQFIARYDEAAASAPELTPVKSNIIYQ